jgi:iron complex transport system substrate-binding protein
MADPAPRPRVASLVPSGTDIVAAIGLGRHLVGVSHECDHAVARDLPVLTSTTLPEGPASARDIDRQVADAVADGRPLYRVDTDALHELEPDVVLAQDVCDVCAVAGPLAAAAVPPGAQLVTLGATSLAALADDLRRVGAVLDASARAEQQVRAITDAHARVAARVAGERRPRVLTLEWGDPPYVGGHWIPELVALAGGRHVLADTGAPSRPASWEEIAEADPDVVVFMPCGYRIRAAVEESRGLLERPEVAGLSAVRAGRWWATDAATLFSRCTPVVVTAVPILAAILHGDLFPKVPRRRAVQVSGEPARGTLR